MPTLEMVRPARNGHRSKDGDMRIARDVELIRAAVHAAVPA